MFPSASAIRHRMYIALRLSVITMRGFVRLCRILSVCLVNLFLRLYAYISLTDGHIFTALHGVQTRSCDENSVRPSVRQTREL